ncbi:carbon-nitrogen hydrolase family protein [Streptomyces apocyni]|uniref:carbon-nitrogen hydrolase family protein n=1 Tax=Streptomyces apocyni TaxID=2654677 RepID=UPI0012EAD9E0|nr:carbon-nitrogen hydrolase family protein [Streptomyces apocyni]
MPPLRTALLQSSGRPGDVAKNLELLDTEAGRAAATGAGLLVCPELYLTGYAIGDDVHRLAEAVDGPSARTVAEIARRHGIAVAYGYPERAGDMVFNAARLVGPDGALLLNYRKTHLFGAFEAEQFTAGDQPVVQAELGGLTVGVVICYDVEFPENVRAHALAGTDLLLVPTALMHPFQIVAESVLPVRAFENQMYLAYANRTGPEGAFEFAGLSTLVGPDGVARARAGRAEELVSGEVDPEFLAASRATNPYLRDRRPGLYTSLV